MIFFLLKDPGTLGGEEEVRREKAWNHRHPFPKSQGWKLVPETTAAAFQAWCSRHEGQRGSWGVGREH